MVDASIPPYSETVLVRCNRPFRVNRPKSLLQFMFSVCSYQNLQSPRRFRSSSPCCGSDSNLSVLQVVFSIRIMLEFKVTGMSKKSVAEKDQNKDEILKDAISAKYGKIAVEGGSCCSSCEDHDPQVINKSLGYSYDEISLFPEAATGLGCGNPLALGEIKEGETVVDLGSGAGMDCFLARRKVGDGGKVIGIDMTEAMVEKARSNAIQHKFDNVEFILGEIEDIPLDDASADVVISNCVINLSLDKEQVFREVRRILKPGGRVYLSDMVLTRELDDVDKDDVELHAGCVAGAVLVDDYLLAVRSSGLEVSDHSLDTGISDRQYDGRPVASIKLKAYRALM